MINISRRFRSTTLLCASATVLAIVGCKDQPLEPKRDVVDLRAISSRILASSVPAEKLGMGGLERYAVHVARALQNKGVRLSIAAALRDPANRGLGIDLTDCKGQTAAAQMLQAGERRGGAAAARLCAEIGARRGLVLYMDPRQLSAWDGTAIPIVTAVAGLNRATPPHLLAYRSPDVLMDIGAETKLRVPTLVIVPMVHPSRWPKGRNVQPPGAGSHSAAPSPAR